MIINSENQYKRGEKKERQKREIGTLWLEISLIKRK